MNPKREKTDQEDGHISTNSIRENKIRDRRKTCKQEEMGKVYL